MSERLWILTGPTASGKTEVAFHLAKELGTEIISADSMQVYRGMDIGTAKPSLELRKEVSHHLIDIVDPWESYSVGRYMLDAQEAVRGVEERGKRCLMVGGTGLYIKALREGLFRGPDADWALREELAAVAEDKGSAYLHRVLQGIDPISAGRIHEKDLRRIIRALEVYQKTGRAISLLQREWGTVRGDSILVVLSLKREDLNRRIEDRVQKMMEEGLVEEVKRLLSHPKGLSKQAREALGYKEISEYLSGRIGLAEAEELIKINTRRFAKRQMTWFRSFSGTRWLEMKEGEDVQGLTNRVMEAFTG